MEYNVYYLTKTIMTQRFFISSSGTHVGKTLITSGLAWQLRQAGKHVCAVKPVISGFDMQDTGNDSACLLQAAGVAYEKETVEKCSPWRFSAPLSPHMAAAMEYNVIDTQALVQFCKRQDSEYVLVEGVGGVMVPLTNDYTVLDWMKALDWPVILVVGSYLGSLSHTLTAVETLRAHGVTLHCVVVSESANSVSLLDTADTIKIFLRNAVPVVTVKRLSDASRPWEQLPPLVEAVIYGV